MSKDEQTEIGQIKQMLEVILSDKFDPQNGWKTERRLFEQATLTTLQTISSTLTEIKEQKLDKRVALLERWRTAILAGIPILLGAFYFFFRHLSE